MVHFSGFARKMNHIPPLASEASERTSSLDFMYGFKVKSNCLALCVFVSLWLKF
ncbi:MAG: hypothetical protein U5L45_19780 [Saprospiraceae bacterium]|nr:hypothetical protein [Saprospiraceae bacterium]